MRRPLVLAFVVLAVLAVVPGWTGEARLALPQPDAVVTAERVPLIAGDPARRRVGSLVYMGGVVLRSRDRAFGGFSAMHVAGDRFTLLSDGGTVLRFRMGADWRVRGATMAALPAGPRTGWRKRDRDAESLAIDPATGRAWVGFESVNAIWRYAPGFARAERQAQPEAIARWRTGGGIESFTRLADGRFVAIAESPLAKERDRRGLVWSGDPVAAPAPAFAFRYAPAPGYDPSDVTQLPDGRLLVLERAFGLPFRWYARLAVVDRAALRPGAIVTGRTLAVLAPPMLDDNWEALAAVREPGGTVIWIASDDNELFLQRTLLVKFRLDDERPAPRPARGR